MTAPAIAAEELSVRYGKSEVVRGVSLAVGQGEWVSLIGPNGAGKSSILRAIAGLIPFAGHIQVGGLSVMGTSRRALARQVALVPQIPVTPPQMTVAENIYLGREPTTWCGLVDMRKMNRMAAELLDRLHIKIKPTAKMHQLSIANIQLAEIAKAVSYNSDLIIMDEPTSAITEAEVEGLFNIIRSLKAQGCAIIYISHKMDEIFKITDEVTVFRDGQYMGTDATIYLDRGRYELHPERGKGRAEELVLGKGPRGRDFYDFESRYEIGRTKFLCPAKLDAEVADQASAIALEVYQLLGCSGFARVDLMLEAETNELYVLEADSIPGLTETSLLPQAAEAADIDFDALIERILDAAPIPTV